MSTFSCNIPVVHALTHDLRADADALQPLPAISFPSFWPLQDFAQALHDALEVANARTVALQSEGNRLAMVMDKLAQAALSVDTHTGQAFEAVAP